MHRRIIGTASSTIPAPTRRPTTNTLTAKRRNSESTARQAGVTHQGDRSPWCVTPAWRAVDSLFRRFAVKVFVVGLRVGAGMVEDAVPMIRRCIELSLIHISEPTRLGMSSYAVFCLK